MIVLIKKLIKRIFKVIETYLLGGRYLILASKEYIVSDGAISLKLEKLELSDSIKKFTFKNYAKPEIVHFFHSNGNRVVNWIIPEIGVGGGGLFNIFRFANFLAQKGFQCNLIPDKPVKCQRMPEKKIFINEHYFPMMPDVHVYDGTIKVPSACLTFATSWVTAYTLLNIEQSLSGTKAYFIQDLEPFFYPISSNYVFAQNTYKLGFHAFCSSSWIFQYVCEMDPQTKGTWLPLGANLDTYTLKPFNFKKNTKKHRLLAYIRPFTERRGFELLVGAIESLKITYKDQLEVFVAGTYEDDPALKAIPCSFVNLGILKEPDLAKIYREIDLAVVLSLTNYSLLPNEIIAAGTPVVDVNFAGNKTSYAGNPGIILAEPTIAGLANCIQAYLDSSLEEKEKIYRSIKKYRFTLSWQNTFRKFYDEFEKVI